MTGKGGLLERLAEGPVVGDGSMCMTLEKRGYCTSGLYTPEAVLFYPDAVRQLLREYLRAGADVLQAPCFYASEKRLKRTKANISVSFLFLFESIFFKLAYSWRVAGSAVQVEASKHLDPLQQMVDALVQCQGEIKIFNIFSTSGSGTAFRPSTNRC